MSDNEEGLIMSENEEGEIMNGNVVAESANMIQMEDRDQYEEIQVPENALHLNNEDDRAYYVL